MTNEIKQIAGRVGATVAIALFACTLPAVAGNATVAEWEQKMQTCRPHLPAKATRSQVAQRNQPITKLRTSNSGKATAYQALAGVLPADAVWNTVFESEEETIDICAFTAADGSDNRFAVYGQLGNYTPYYWTVDGLPAACDFDGERFLKTHCLVGDASKITGAPGILAADEVEIDVFRWSVFVPYGRFRLFFVDDCPNANWAHPCRLIFVAANGRSFTVFYLNMPPTIVYADGGEPVPMPIIGGPGEQSRAQSLAAVKNRVYAYANALRANGLAYATGNPDTSYFILVSGGGSAKSNGIRFWSDTAMLYSTLTLKYGVSRDNITVLVSDGTSPEKDACLAGDVLVDSPRDLDGDGIDDVDGAANRDNLQTCLTRLTRRLRASDQLFVLMTSHGGADGVAGIDNYDSYISLYGSYVDDDELAAWTKNIKCPVAFAIESCESGGFVDDIVGTADRAIVTASRHDESSWGHSGSVAIWDGLGYTDACNCYLGPLNAAFRGFKPAPFADSGHPWTDSGAVDVDTNGDGLVSLVEAHAYAKKNDTAEEHPQYGESTPGLGDRFFMLNQSTEIPVPYPDNDEFADAIPITGLFGTVDGSTIGATSEAQEPLLAFKKLATNSVWWAWTAPRNERMQFNTVGSDFDTIMGIYTGKSVSSLRTIARNDDIDYYRKICVSSNAFNAVSGTVYYIAVAGFDASGAVKLNWSPADKAYHLVEFDANGGTTDETSRWIAGGSPIETLPTPTRAGYSFAGWYTAKSGGSKIDTSTVVKSNITYYAHWAVPKYKLTLKLGANVTKIYYKINGAKSWTAITKDKTLSVEGGSTWYAYAEAQDGYTADYPDSKHPLERVKAKKAETATLNAKVTQYKLTLKLGTNITKIYYKTNGAKSWTAITKNKTLNVDGGSTWYAYAEGKTGYASYCPDPAKPLTRVKARTTETVTFKARAIPTCKLTLKLGANVTKVYYKINGATAWKSLTKDKTLNVYEGSAWCAYATGKSGYMSYCPDPDKPLERIKAAKAETVTFKARAVSKYKLTLKLGAHMAKVYYKINGATAWTAITKDKTLNVYAGSTWYAYAEGKSGYVSYCPDQAAPLERVKAKKAETVTFNTKAIAKSATPNLLANATVADKMAVPEFMVEHGVLLEVIPNGATEIEVPDTVVEIGEAAFVGCTEVERVILPETVQVIGEFAFFGCAALEELVLPSGELEVSDTAFLGCPGLADEDGKVVIDGIPFDCAKPEPDRQY